MSLGIGRLNHILLPCKDQAQFETMCDFYGRFVGLPEIPTPPPPRRQMVFKWFDGRPTEVHVTITDPDLPQTSAVYLNPSVQPHYGFQVDDAQAIAKKLGEAGFDIHWATEYGFPSRHQLFMRDPGGNVLEFLELKR